MEKYGVVTEPRGTLEKTASGGVSCTRVCPRCRALVTVEGANAQAIRNAVWVCPNCGTEPFEEKKA